MRNFEFIARCREISELVRNGKSEIGAWKAMDCFSWKWIPVVASSVEQSIKLKKQVSKWRPNLGLSLPLICFFRNRCVSCSCSFPDHVALLHLFLVNFFSLEIFETNSSRDGQSRTFFDIFDIFARKTTSGKNAARGLVQKVEEVLPMMMCGKKRVSVDAFLVRKKKSNLGFFSIISNLIINSWFVQNPLSGPIEAPHSSGIEMINCLF